MAANQGPTGSTGEPARKAQGQESKSGQQQARTEAGSSQQQPGARGAREGTGGLSRRDYGPGALSTRAFMTSPFSFMRRMMEDLDRMFEEFGPGEASMGRRELQRPFAGREAFWAPDVDVFEREGRLVVRADLPGLSKDDVHVQLEEGALVLEGERHRESEEEREGTYRSERIYGSFRRVIPLPEGADPETAEAHFENGVLEVSLRLPEEKARTRRIEIQEREKPSMH